MTTLPPIIHVVDDDASFRSAVGELLSACGYGVALYEFGRAALADAAAAGIPAVFCWMCKWPA